MKALKIIAVALAALILVGVFCYIMWFHEWLPVLPKVVPPDLREWKDQHAATASALQENANLLMTLALATAAFFGFGVGDNFATKNGVMALSLLFVALFAASLAFVGLYAFGIYRAIALQTDQGMFFLGPIDHLLTIQTRWVMVCSIQAVIAFAWRCIKA
jgi:hypothetical protein